jgi:hypothetical protein
MPMLLLGIGGDEAGGGGLPSNAIVTDGLIGVTTDSGIQLTTG